MAESVGARLTSAGKELLAKAVAGKKLEFTKGAIGDAMVQGTTVSPSAEQQENYTGLIHQRITTAISSMTTSGTTAKITISVDNSDVASGFQIAEIGLFAKDPDTNAEILYCYIYAGTQGDVLPASDGVPKTFTYEIQTLISNATNVTAQISTVEVPIATKDSAGIVRVGKGLTITDSGLLSCTVEGGSTTTASFSDKVTLSNGLQAQSATSDFRSATLYFNKGNVSVEGATIKGDASITGNVTLTGSPVFQGSASTNKTTFSGKTVFTSQPTLQGGLYARGNDTLTQEFDVRKNTFIMSDCRASVNGTTLVGGPNNPYMHFLGDDIYIDAGGTLSADSKALKFTGKTLAVTSEDCTVSISGGVRGQKVTPMYLTEAFDATDPATAPSVVGTPISGTFFLAKGDDSTSTHIRSLIFVGYVGNQKYSFKIADVGVVYKTIG